MVEVVWLESVGRLIADNAQYIGLSMFFYAAANVCSYLARFGGTRMGAKPDIEIISRLSKKAYYPFPIGDRHYRREYRGIEKELEL